MSVMRAAGAMHLLPVEPEWGHRLAQAAAVHRREKSVVYAVFVLVGTGSEVHLLVAAVEMPQKMAVASVSTSHGR